MTYRRTQRACRFADRGKKNLRGGSRGWRGANRSPRKDCASCARLFARAKTRRSAVGHLRNGNERVRVNVERNRRLGFAIVGQLAHASKQKVCPRARRFDGINAIEPRIKILEPGNRSKVLRPSHSSIAFPTFFQIHPFPSARNGRFTPHVRFSFPVGFGIRSRPATERISRDQIEFFSILNHGFFPEAKKVTDARALINRRGRTGRRSSRRGSTIHAGIHPRFGFGARGRRMKIERRRTEGGKNGRGRTHFSLFSS